MNWGSMTIGKKITLGFGIVLLFLIAVAALSFQGVGGIVTNAQEVIYGRNLDGTLAQREVDHLNWVNQVNALLTDTSVTKLTVETDHTKCAFGKWLFSDERREAEARVPGLAELFKAIESPHKHLHESAIEIGEVFRDADAHLPAILQARINDHLRWAAGLKDAFLNNAAEITVNTDPATCGLGRWMASEEARMILEKAPPAFKAAWEELTENHDRLHQSARKIVETYAQVHEGLTDILKDRLIDHKNWAEEVSVAIIRNNADLDVQMDHTLCEFGRFLASDTFKGYATASPDLAAFAEKVAAPHKALHDSAKIIQSDLTTFGGQDKAQQIFASQTFPALEAVSDLITAVINQEKKLENAQHDAIVLYDTKTHPLLEKTVATLEQLAEIASEDLKGMNQANQIFATKTKPNLEQVQTSLRAIRDRARDFVMTDAKMLASAQGVKRNVSIIGITAIVIGMLFAFFIVKGIVRILTSVSSKMEEGSSQVSAASGQVSSSSQSLAEGSSEQAASIEETSSSLEEMSSMTKKNAENAGEADRLMQEANTVVDRANQAMEQVTASMTEITKASEETSKIIKTIDEIAFQTNLLALNAAVEAARAGEAGAGFAVVADEVRNLAMRAAEAAKSTSTLIEGTVKKVKDGNDLVHETSESFRMVAESSTRVAQLVSEISAASGEQSEGIEQVNIAVAEMDKVIQQNAANAEESAAAAEELDAQAHQMKEVVEELMRLVGQKSGASAPSASTRRVQPGKRLTKSERTMIQHHPGKSTKKKLTKTTSEVRPEDVIPLDDDGFEDF